MVSPRLSSLRRFEALRAASATSVLLLARFGHAEPTPPAAAEAPVGQPTPPAARRPLFGPAGPDAGQPPWEDQEALVPRPESAVMELAAAPGFSIGLEGEAGETVLFVPNDSRAHLFAGGLVRLRYSYLELGAQAEVSDRDQERWRMLGGFAGALLPFTRWVDVEGAISLNARRYDNPDLRYGSGGLDVGTSALGLRIGISDRSSSKLLGVRLGAAIVAAFDLQRKHRSWDYETSDPDLPLTGTTTVGGYNVGLAVTGGFDLLWAR